jgi:hypothetical protein
MNFIAKLLPLFLVVACGDLHATTPPRSPDYCGVMLCFEASPSFEVMSVKNSINRANFPKASEMEVVGKSGSLKMSVEEFASKAHCETSKFLNLKRFEESFEGEVIISGPDSCYMIKISFSKLALVGKLSEQPPITAIWVADMTPSTFWKGGYAIRLGPQVEIILPSLK